MDAQSNGVSIAIVPVLILLALLITVVSVIGWIARYFREMAAERRRLRLEVSKLAHELELLRSERNDEAKDSREPTALSNIVGHEKPRNQQTRRK